MTPPSIERSLGIQKRAKKRIPGMTQLLSKRPDRFSYGVWPGYYSRAKGVEVWDLDGNRYIDMSIGGIGANVLGYADPDVDAAVRAAIERGTSCSLNCPEEVELADLMCSLHPWAEMVRYARSGGEAMCIAVRIARAYTGREIIAFCGYHGWHDWYLAANIGTKDALGQHLIPGLEPAGVPKGLKGTALPFKYNDFEALKSIVDRHGRSLAAVVMEPIRNQSPAPGFLSKVRQLTHDCNAAFIIDEISAGFRMNTGGAHLKLDIEPDMAVFSKAMGNGYPIAAIIGKHEIMSSAQHTFISSTAWTERLGPVAAIATVTKHRGFDVGAHLTNIGRAVQEGWKRLAEKHGLSISIGGIYALSHFKFNVQNPLATKAYFVQLMLEQGFLASTLFYAMYAHNLQHVESYLSAADQAFARIAESIQRMDIENKLSGKPATAGFGRIA